MFVARLPPEKQPAAALCMDMLASAMAVKSSAYVAGPLDTGLLYYDTLRKASNLSPCEIRRLNKQRLAAFAARLRDELAIPVVDPGHLQIEGWTGGDYALLFLDVIRVFVREMWFLEGWEFSHGACDEFCFSIQHRLPCYDEAGRALSAGAGAALMEKAIAGLREHQVSPDVLEGYREKLLCLPEEFTRPLASS